MYLDPASEDSWSINPLQEKPVISVYCLAERAACSFQSTVKLSTAAVASATLYPEPALDESWSISPRREKPVISRYC